MFNTVVMLNIFEEATVDRLVTNIL